MRRSWNVVAAVAVLAAAAGAQEASCAECHGSESKLRAALGDPARDVGRLIVDSAVLSRTVHRTQSCDQCHMDYGGYPHAEGRSSAGCTDCHDKAAEVFAKSVHGKAAPGKETPLVACKSCHGVHDVFKPSERESTLHPLNVHVTCTRCHQQAEPLTVPGEPRFERYASDEHAHGIIGQGLTVSATCVACHGGHEVKAKGDPDSQLARERVDALCGKCHVVPFEQYRKSIHFLKSEGPEHKGATCSDCHAPHGISVRKNGFVAHSVEACSRCHEERGTSFKLSYHGKVTNLGHDAKVATCNTCHDNHAILPASSPESKIHPGRIVATCGECHERSHQRFAGFLVHADPRDGERYPILNAVWLAMLGLIVVVMILGGGHVGLWLVRSLGAKEWRLKHHIHETSQRHVRHMRPFLVGLNTVATSSILLLAGTGLPLYFSTETWAKNLMRFFGGTQAAAFVHRLAAIVLMITFAVFVAHVVWRWLGRKEKGLFGGPFSMVPRRKDFSDAAAYVKWFFGRGPKPKFGRYVYWEKFDFWAVFWGMAIMGFTGLMLWFPEQFSLVLPAWLINAAGVIHGMEALLAIAFHFAVQAFQINLRPDKFPLDEGYYTGVIPEAELREERPEEYELLRASGQLEKMITPPPSRGAKIAARIFGASTLVLGLLLLAMTAFALLT